MAAITTNKETIPSKLEKKEIVTPHRLSVAIMIREFCKIRGGIAFLGPTHRKPMRNFCILCLNLIQSPDLTLEELRNLMNSGEYSLREECLTRRFESTVTFITKLGIRFLLDTVDSIGGLMTPDKESMVNKNSVIGYFLRRLIINFDTLTFSEITSFYDAYTNYSKSLVLGSDSMECTGTLDNISSTRIKSSLWSLNRDWSRRQAELFIATQSALITNNEEKALSPNVLQKHIQNLLKTNRDLSEAHFLSYINYLRVKEFCGAINSLYHCFDKCTIAESKATSDEKSKSYRFAALNLAILHYNFGHKEEALYALKEAIRMAQEANDNICLQHSLSWLYCLTMNNRHKLMEHSIFKSLDLNLSYIMSLGIQSFIQYASITMGTPKQVFSTITKSDIINCQHSHRDLISTSFSQKSAIWLFYGKTEMSSLWSQLLLYLNTDNPTVSKTYYGEGYCQALCNMAGQLHQEGDYITAYSILNLAKQRFPHEPISHIWMLCDGICNFQHLLYNERLEDAESVAGRIAVIDKWESYLRNAELLIFKKDYVEAHNCVNQILGKCKDGSKKFRMDVQVRAMILLSDIQIATNFPDSMVPGILGLLNSSLAYANDYNLQYLASIAQLHIAHVQLLMGMPAQALAMLDRCLTQILAHGGRYDRARAMLLHVKCLVADANNKTAKERNKVIMESFGMLNSIKKNFEKMEAYFRVKDVLYLQAQLYNEVDNIKKRNQCSMEYRLIDENHPSKNDTALLTLL